MAVRIMVDGPDAVELEGVVRAALGPRLEEESWLVFILKVRARWGVSVLVSPQDRLEGWSFFGPWSSIASAVKEAVRKAGLESIERRVRKVPHTPERRRTACDA